MFFYIMQRHSDKTYGQKQNSFRKMNISLVVMTHPQAFLQQLAFGVFVRSSQLVLWQDGEGTCCGP